MTLPKFNAPDLGNAPSTSEIITRHLRDAIVAGHFAEDEPIRQDDIARQFNVSKIPVREALKRLEAEGLVMFQRNRGAMVTRVSDAELAQMFEVRMLLEDKVLRLAIPNMTEETFARAERICQEFIGEDDVGRWAELNWELHACLYEPAQRPFLVGLIRSVNDKLERVISNVIRDGVSGLVVCGSVGENTSLSAEEKIAVTEVAVDASRGRVPVICGVAEFTSIQAAKVANAVRRVGVDGVMLMPALVYGSKPFETAEHYRYVAKNADVPLMVYNNPPIYKNDVTPDILISLADCDNVVCFKDSSGDTRRFIDVRNEVGDRFVLFAGLDDVVLESIAVGAEGWVSGMSNVFPKEGETIFRLAKAGRFAEAMPIYEWLMPILHLDARADLVQCIKLCEAIAGRGSALTRPPRLALPEADRVFVEQIMAKAMANRPELPDVGL